MKNTPDKKTIKIDSPAQQDESDSATMETDVKKQDLVNARVATKKWNQLGVGDSLAGPGTLVMTPGAMQMSATVKLHSRLSINLFRGRKGDPAKNIRPIIGLARFARQVSLVWSAAALDDPFADKVLLNIEQAYIATKELVDKKMDAMKYLLDGLDEFEITLQASEQPVSILLHFYSPWGFRGATLLNQFDKLVRMALTARHLGIFTESDWETVIHESQRAIRHLFVEVDAWVATGVKRVDIRDITEIAIRAQQKYMTLKKSIPFIEDDILTGKVRAELSPVNRILEMYLVETEKNIVKSEKINTDIKKPSVAKKPNFGFSIQMPDTEHKNTIRSE